uniref:NADH-ubiquinone oxidoreductase chain 3 n=1 Tax=Cirrhinus mrigala TaxID=683832 RepID=H9C4Y4_CIRMR|nr:NADH dehydrogenase subunit 3 [Cirrhinus mrigala]AFD96676.1 NADH dehydrogenase subunit 3 [Cirrhinus mrigala]
MNLIMTILVSTVALSLMRALASLWLPHMNPDAEKLSPYECGFDPLGSARLPVSLRLFPFAITCRLSDLESALLLRLPWGDWLHNTNWVRLLKPQQSWSYSTLGLIYEWTLQEGLEWAE